MTPERPSDLEESEPALRRNEDGEEQSVDSDDEQERRADDAEALRMIRNGEAGT